MSGPSAAVLLMVCVWVVAGGCGRDSRVGEIVLAGRSAVLIDLLDACSSAADSPASRECSALSEAIQPCRAVVAVCSLDDKESGEGCRLIDNLECAEPEDLVRAGLDEQDDWLLRGPLPGDGGTGSFLLLGHQELDAGRHEKGEEGSGSHRIVARIEGASPNAGWQRWLPSGQAPGGFTLASADAFLHLRWRPTGGILPEGERPETLADRLYGLRARLFSAAVLTGDVELVLFVPSEGSLFPGSAVALDFHLRRPAVAAMEEYIEDLQQQWPLTRSAYRAGTWTGACLGNLNVMPELAPCYVATEGAIVVGWNRASLEAALGMSSNASRSVDGARGSQAWDDRNGASRVSVDLEQLALADRRLADARHRGVAFDYPFAQLEVRGARDGDAFVVELALRPGTSP